VVAGYAEADIAKMAVGESATITLPALPDSTVTGTVTAVAPTSTVVSNVVTYDVTIAVDNPPSTVKVGMTADVSVVVQTVSNTLELPSAAITTTGPISTVTVLANGVKKVTTGHHRRGGRLDHADRERPEGQARWWWSRWRRSRPAPAPPPPVASAV
jgi:multidrug efflux pump subunit AcrA (membrane-fusion protein)